ncbi:MAG: hypothetical protein JSW67_03715 [Candidatus Latescibacterota bacterium]|nr:MAG: hypothetical protein JSW67_03715 [Candidatus Latescibacterota bacterium]
MTHAERSPRLRVERRKEGRILESGRWLRRSKVAARAVLSTACQARRPRSRSAARFAMAHARLPRSRISCGFRPRASCGNRSWSLIPKRNGIRACSFCRTPWRTQAQRAKRPAAVRSWTRMATRGSA